jgi:spore coat protein CotH
MSENFTDEAMGYQQFIDVSSFIDFFLMNELSHNVDAYRISTFMHKDKGEKLKMGPIWDFNIAFGNADYCRGETTDDWAYKFNEYCPEDSLRVPFWWARLLQDPTYVVALKERWIELRAGILSQSNIQGKIAEHAFNLKCGYTKFRHF